MNTSFERLLDEHTSNQLDVIFTLREDQDEDSKKYIAELGQVAGRRRSIVTARDLTPPHFDKWKDQAGILDRNARKRLKNTNLLSAKSLMASYNLQSIELESWRVNSAFRLKELEDILPAHAKRNHSLLTNTQSIVTKIKRDDLASIASEMALTADVYPNRTIRQLPVFRNDGLPPEVEDHKTYSWGLQQTGAMAAWGAYDAKGQGVKVAILDTGVDPNHPDLEGKIEDFAEFDRNGKIVRQGADQAYDSGSHGTHCAGTVVGGKASGRYIGMAPEARILAGLVLKNGSGSDGQILAGIDWAISSGADVISMSLGAIQFSAQVDDLYFRQFIKARQLGIPVVVAAGNDGSQITGSPGSHILAFTVGATDVDDRVAGFSGGRTQVILESEFIDPNHLPLVYSKPDITAPGVQVYSCVPGKDWEAWNGTSMATPHVAGALAQLLSRQGNLHDITSPQKVDILQSLLLSSVKEFGESGQDHRYGFGRLDVLRALGNAEDNGYW